MITAQITRERDRRHADRQRPTALLLSVPDVAAVLSLGVTYTRRLIDQGDIKSVRVGKRVLVPRQYLDEYIAALVATAQR